MERLKMNRDFARNANTKTDREEWRLWIKRNDLKIETEVIIYAAKEGVLRTM